VHAQVKTFIVATGSKNVPAIQLYLSEGFVEVGGFEPDSDDLDPRTGHPAIISEFLLKMKVKPERGYATGVCSRQINDKRG